jgi:hypothetical protein
MDPWHYKNWGRAILTSSIPYPNFYLKKEFMLIFILKKDSYIDLD